MKFGNVEVVHDSKAGVFLVKRTNKLPARDSKNEVIPDKFVESSEVVFELKGPARFQLLAELMEQPLQEVHKHFMHALPIVNDTTRSHELRLERIRKQTAEYNKKNGITA